MHITTKLLLLSLIIAIAPTQLQALQTHTLKPTSRTASIVEAKEQNGMIHFVFKISKDFSYGGCELTEVSATSSDGKKLSNPKLTKGDTWKITLTVAKDKLKGSRLHLICLPDDPEKITAELFHIELDKYYQHFNKK